MCRVYEWVISNSWMSFVTPMNESRHAYEWVLSHSWSSHITRMHESCHAYARVVAQKPWWGKRQTQLQSPVCFPSRFLEYVWHELFVRATWLIYMWCDFFICVTWLIHRGDLTHSYVWHDSFLFKAVSFLPTRSLVYVCHDFMCDMTHSYNWRDTYECTTRLKDVCIITHDSFMCVTQSILIHAMTHSCMHTHTSTHARTPTNMSSHENTRKYVFTF